MTSLIKLVVSNYNEVLKNVKGAKGFDIIQCVSRSDEVKVKVYETFDISNGTAIIRKPFDTFEENTRESFKNPMVDSWPLMESPGPMLCIVGAYLLFVLKVGPKMMEKRPAFELNAIMIGYNAFQVLFSIWLTTLALDVDIKYLFPTHGYDNRFSLHSQNTNIQMKISRGAWWYFFAKIIELLDTVFFVLRKKQNQITFLHVFHHTTTAVFSWCYLKFLPGEQGIIIGFLNSTVHIIMYSYYLIAALGPKYRKYLWWKKYMTWIQLMQFGLMLVYLILTLIMDYRTPKALTYFFTTVVIIFIYLFSDFYRQAYKKKIT